MKIYKQYRSLHLFRVGFVGVDPHPQFMSTDAPFWVKIGFKFQSLGKISNICAADPPSSFRSIPTLHLLRNDHSIYNWLLSVPALRAVTRTGASHYACRRPQSILLQAAAASSNACIGGLLWRLPALHWMQDRPTSWLTDMTRPIADFRDK